MAQSHGAARTYRQVTFNGRAMADCFADADWPTVNRTVKEMKSPLQVGTIDHALINSDSFFDTVKEALRPAGQPRPRNQPQA